MFCLQGEQQTALVDAKNSSEMASPAMLLPQTCPQKKKKNTTTNKWVNVIFKGRNAHYRNVFSRRISCVI